MIIPIMPAQYPLLAGRRHSRCVFSTLIHEPVRTVMLQGRGQSWRAAIQKGLSLLPEKRKAAAERSLGDALSTIGAELEGFTGAAAK